MTTIGYCRISSRSQNDDSQRAALKAAGCEIIRSETISGLSRSGRSELETVLAFIRPGDELVVVRCDRLARNSADLLAIVDELKKAGGSLRVLEPPISTADPVTGELLIHLLGIVSALEVRFLKQRQMAGIERRRELDRALPPSQRAYKGRKKVVQPTEVLALKQQGLGVTDIARTLGISRASVYRNDGSSPGMPAAQNSTSV